MGKEGAVGIILSESCLFIVMPFRRFFLGCGSSSLGYGAGAHADDGIQRHTVQLGKLGNQVDRIKSGNEDGHADGAQNQADDGAVLALIDVRPDGGRQNEGAAHHEIC